MVSDFLLDFEKLLVLYNGCYVLVGIKFAIILGSYISKFICNQENPVSIGKLLLTQ